MKVIKTPRTVIDLTYEAIDGTIFTDEAKCKHYEDTLYFEKFQFDPARLIEGLNKKNISHYLYYYIKNFGNENYYHLLPKPILKDTKKLFLNLLYYFIDKEQRRSRMNSAWRKELLEHDIVKAFHFLFVFKAITVDDILTVKYSADNDAHNDIIKSVATKIYYMCLVEYDSTEAFDIVFKNTVFPVSSLFDIKPPITSSITFDLLTSLATGKDGILGSVSIERRIKWFTYLIQLDIPTKLFMVSTKDLLWSANHEGKPIYTYISIDDLIKYIITASKNVFSGRPFLKALKQAGPMFIETNVDNQKPKILTFSEDIFLKVVKILEDKSNTQSKLSYEVDDLVLRYKPSSYSTLKMLCFYIDTHEKRFKNKQNVCVITDTSNRKEEEIFQSDIVIWMKNPDGLIKKLTYFLNDKG